MTPLMLVRWVQRDGLSAPWVDLDQINPTLRGGPLRLVRGGSYVEPAYALRGAARHWFISSPVRSPWIGFRCAEDR